MRAGRSIRSPVERDMAAMEVNSTVNSILFFLKKYQAPKVENRKSPSLYATVVKRKTYGKKA